MKCATPVTLTWCHTWGSTGIGWSLAFDLINRAFRILGTAGQIPKCHHTCSSSRIDCRSFLPSCPGTGKVATCSEKQFNSLPVEVFIYTIAKLYIPVGPAWHDSRILFSSSSLLAHIFHDFPNWVMSGCKLVHFIVSALMAFDVPLDKYKSRGTPCRDPKLIRGHQSEFALRCIYRRSVGSPPFRDQWPRGVIQPGESLIPVTPD